MMAGLNNDNECISINSHNCGHASNFKLPLFNDLLEGCDFLLLQEHMLFKSKLIWFNSISSDVGVHGVSAMDESKPLVGRPYGGVAILWRKSLVGQVVPVHWDSSRFCAVKYTNASNASILVICVYMPCDDWRPDGNIIEYNQLLQDISLLMNSVQVDSICIGGDFNTDFTRDTCQTESLKSFIYINDLHCCTNDPISDIDFTFNSKINGRKTFIDHFLLSPNLKDKILKCSSLDTINNTSDHVPISCKIKYDVSYTSNVNHSKPHISRPVWDQASEIDIESYSKLLDRYLMQIPLPNELINCNNLHCQDHFNEICNFHNDIVNALVMASDDAIPMSTASKSKSKVVVGWNDNVEHYFRTSLFWHKLWVECGRPEQGIIANIHRTTRNLYHKTRKQVLRNEGLIISDKLSQSSVNESSNVFWKKVKSTCPKVTRLPTYVDDIQGDNNIAEHFKNNFENLFNCVSYDDNEMKSLTENINTSITTNNNNDESRTLVIEPELVENGINRLKSGKNDGSLPLKSENLIHSTDILHSFLSVLFSVMIRHGCAPDGMLMGTMVPLPKGKFNDLSKSKNFRALTISSIFGKVLDNIILNIEHDNLFTNDLQFSFKKGLSTTICSTMVRETISYFNHKGSAVYSLVLDATKAFDRINYCKLFKILLERNINPLICRLLLYMYTNQKLRVKWANEYSGEFTVSNGVKQGGVISPLLYCIYIDGLINELIASGVGCFMGSVYAGIFMFADDLKLLAPSVSALNTMLNICINYAAKFDIIFNDKSQLIIYNASNDIVPTPDVFINGVKLNAVTNVNHLGHIIQNNIYKNDVSKCVGDFYKQFNSFMSDYSMLSSRIKHKLFISYCTAFYGAQFLPVHDDKFMNPLYVAWRTAMKRVWKLPRITHNNLLPIIANVIPPDLMMEKRAIKFINNLLSSDNITVKTITGIALNDHHSVLCKNYNYLLFKYDLSIANVFSMWESYCKGQPQLVRKCEQINELIDVRDSFVDYFLSQSEAKDIIDYLCVE